jgi:hypothetical protein
MRSLLTRQIFVILYIVLLYHLVIRCMGILDRIFWEKVYLMFQLMPWLNSPGCDTQFLLLVNLFHAECSNGAHYWN